MTEAEKKRLKTAKARAKAKAKTKDQPLIQATVRILRTKQKPSLIIKVAPPTPNFFQVHLLGGIT